MASYRNYLRIALIMGLLVLACAGAQATSDIVGACYLADTPFPEFMPYWQEGWNYKDENGEQFIHAKPGMPLGGYAFLYFRNTSSEPIRIADLMLQGVKMSEALAHTHVPENLSYRYQASILLSELPKSQIDKLVEAGTPVWWKADPMTVPAGGIAEICIRLRRDPKVKQLDLEIVTDSGDKIKGTIPVGPAQPRFDTISFAPDMQTVFLYAHCPKAGQKPVKVLLDGKDVTQAAKIGLDESSLISPVVLKLQEKLPWNSYHTFQAVYADGTQAIAGIRAWGHEMVYGIWGTAEDMGTTEQTAKAQVKNWTTHGMNAIMGMYPGECNPWFTGKDGWAYTESLGMGRMMHYLVKDQTPLFFFLMDEPDACDTHTEQVPFGDRLGTSGQWLVEWQAFFHRREPNTPCLLNIDGTYKPENYYMYHQLPDIPCIDPYYQAEMDLAYTVHPWALPYKTKPTHVLAAATCSQSAGRPKPLHVILTSSRLGWDEAHKYDGRYPTPEEKRMEVYYTLAAGGKGISYWWYTPDSGIGVNMPSAKALWKEIGLLGAEVRTAGPVITASCPIKLPVKASRYLWVRTLASGLDTVEVIVVNDNVLCDRVGTVYKPVQDAKVSVTAPSWLKAKDVFEVTYQGIKDVKWSEADGKLSLDLGNVDISRFVLVTSDPTLRSRLEDRYKTMFAENVAGITTGN